MPFVVIFQDRKIGMVQFPCCDVECGCLGCRARMNETHGLGKLRVAWNYRSGIDADYNIDCQLGCDALMKYRANSLLKKQDPVCPRSQTGRYDHQQTFSIGHQLLCTSFQIEVAPRLSRAARISARAAGCLKRRLSSP